jgi:CopG family nickel-responsive transcriptional regulator
MLPTFDITTGIKMRRITISVDEELAQQFDDLIARHGYENRSEAFRDLVRARLEQERKELPWKALHGVATVTYIYNFHERDLATRLAALQHDHHDLCVSSSRIVLDHNDCLENVVLRGKFRDIDAFANMLIAQAGVRHGNVHIVPLQLNTPSHASHKHQHFLTGS